MQSFSPLNAKSVEEKGIIPVDGRALLDGVEKKEFFPGSEIRIWNLSHLKRWASGKISDAYFNEGGGDFS